MSKQKIRNFTKAEWNVAFKNILKHPIDQILQSHESGLNMMQHIYSSDTFLETLDWIREHYGYKAKDEVTKGVVFVLGIAVLNQLFVDELNSQPY